MNPSGENSERYVLFLEADPASAKKSLAILDETRAKLVAAAKSAEGIGDASARGTSKANARLADFTARVDGATAQLQEMNAQASGVDRLAISLDRAATSAAKVGGVGLGKAQSVAGAAGGVVSLFGGSEAASAASSILGLTAALGPAGAVAGTAAVAYGILTREMEANKQMAEGLADKYAQLGDLVASGATSEDVQKRIDKLKTSNQFIADQYDDIVRLYNRLIQRVPSPQAESDARGRQGLAQLTGQNDPVFQYMQKVFRFISEATGETVVTMSQLGTVMQGVAAKSNTYTDEIGELEELLDSGALAANNAAAAQEKLKDVLTDSSNAINEGLKDVAAAEKAVRDASEKTAEARSALAESEAEHSARIVKLQTDATDKETDARIKAQDDRRTAEEKAEADREKQLETHLKRVADIEKQYARSFEQAVGDRDAYAAKQAETTRKDALDAEQDANKERLEAIDSALAEQNKAIDKRLDEQLAAVKKNAKETIDAENESYNKRQRQLQESLDKAVAAEQFANNRLENERSLNAYRQQYWAGVVEAANQKMADANAALANSAVDAAAKINAASIVIANGSASNGQSGNTIVSGAFTSAYAVTPFTPSYSTVSRSRNGTPQDRPIIINVNGMGMTLAQVINSNLAVIDTLLDKGA